MTPEEALEEFGGFATVVARDLVPKSTDMGSYSTLDAEQEAFVGLLEAVEAFPGDIASQPGQFRAYARRVIRNRIGEMIARGGFVVSGSREALYSSEWPVGVELVEELCDTASYDEGLEVEDSEDFDAIVSRFDLLTENQRKIMGLYYLDGLLNDTLVAERLGKLPHKVRDARVRAEERLRNGIVERYSKSVGETTEGVS